MKKIKLKKPAVQPTPEPASKKRVKKETVSTPAPYFIPGYPIEDGPNKYARNGKSLELTSQEVTVTMDAGTFHYVWALVDARARSDHQKYSSIPNIKRVTEEATKAFRRSGHHSFGTPAKKLKLKVKVKK